MTLPVAEETLQHHLGERYRDHNWRPALDAIMHAEGDATTALQALKLNFRDLSSIDKLLEPANKIEIRNSPYRFEGGDADILKEVHKKFTADEGDDEDAANEDEDFKGVKEVTISQSNAILMYQQLETVCLKYGFDLAVDLSYLLQKLQINLKYSSRSCCFVPRSLLCLKKAEAPV
ncbi:hypothetical protein AX16_009053 [Volvariella volvacea WC 439]|nr:hypothetical protein AX16_009053 [Volvariella volvacea WC 439]